jgi:hypothetical protein
LGGKLGGVVEGLIRSHAQRTLLVDDAVLVEEFFALKHGVLGGLQHSIKAAQHGEG